MVLVENKNKYDIQYTSDFKKGLKRAVKRNKDISKLTIIINKLASGEQLDKKYKDHELKNAKYYNNCRECHIDQIGY